MIFEWKGENNFLENWPEISARDISTEFNKRLWYVRAQTFAAFWLSPERRIENFRQLGVAKSAKIETDKCQKLNAKLFLWKIERKKEKKTKVMVRKRYSKDR